MLSIMVLPVTIVILLIAISKMNVKKQDKKSAHVNDIPYLAPATTIDVTLPVPTTYPTINSPGRMDNRKFLNLLLLINRKNDNPQYKKKCLFIRIMVMIIMAKWICAGILMQNI